mmetsp:Transcript_18472/g.34202  ORF Transcript_18472/g.34202 Transcript_18472/m.34202 type:complete len:517 (+) Transcript_18472:422-1972(+)
MNYGVQKPGPYRAVETRRFAATIAKPGPLSLCTQSWLAASAFYSEPTQDGILFDLQIDWRKQKRSLLRRPIEEVASELGPDVLKHLAQEQLEFVLTSIGIINQDVFRCRRIFEILSPLLLLASIAAPFSVVFTNEDLQDDLFDQDPIVIAILCAPFVGIFLLRLVIMRCCFNEKKLLKRLVKGSRERVLAPMNKIISASGQKLGMYVEYVPCYVRTSCIICFAKSETLSVGLVFGPVDNVNTRESRFDANPKGGSVEGDNKTNALTVADPGTDSEAYPESSFLSENAFSQSDFASDVGSSFSNMSGDPTQAGQNRNIPGKNGFAARGRPMDGSQVPQQYPGQYNNQNGGNSYGNQYSQAARTGSNNNGQGRRGPHGSNESRGLQTRRARDERRARQGDRRRDDRRAPDNRQGEHSRGHGRDRDQYRRPSEDPNKRGTLPSPTWFNGSNNGNRISRKRVSNLIESVRERVNQTTFSRNQMGMLYYGAQSREEKDRQGQERVRRYRANSDSATIRELI